MEVSYKKLWKVLIDKDMKKKDLQAAAGISWASVTKLSKGETVSMEVVYRQKTTSLIMFFFMGYAVWGLVSFYVGVLIV